MAKMIFTQSDSSALKRIKKIAKFFGILNKANENWTLEQLLNSIPITTKDDLIRYAKKNEESLLSDAVLFSETSGTTGEPLQIPRSNIDLKWNTLNQVNAYKKNLQPGIDRVAIIHSSVLSPFVEASCLALKELDIGYVRIFPIPKVCDYDRIKSVLECYKITTIMTTPSLAYKVIYEISKINGKKSLSNIKNVLLTGEHITQYNAENMKSMLNEDTVIKPFIYGASETATLMHGRDDFGYTPIMDDFCFEVEGETEKENESDFLISGKLIVTWLRDGMLPIVRYDTGDKFSVYKSKKNGELVFFSNGRNLASKEDIEQRNSIDKAIYSLPFPVYHYEYTKNGGKPILNIISNSSIDGDKSFVNNLLSEILPDTEIILNRKNCSFFDFSPKPKMQKYFL